MDSHNVDSISLRPVTAADGPFLLKVYKSSRGEDLRGLGWEEERISEFLDMQYTAQQNFYETDYRQASDQVVLFDGLPVGRMIIETRENEIRCVDLGLLPEYRRLGVGTELLRQLQQQATTARKPLRLQVIRFSRAVSLFERLGFVRTSETGTHFQMEWNPVPGDRSLTE